MKRSSSAGANASEGDVVRAEDCGSCTCVTVRNTVIL